MVSCQFVGDSTSFVTHNCTGLVSIKNKQASTMKNYAALSTVIASVKPSSTQSSAYTPTNSPASCPDLSDIWAASDNLPPTPNSALCECMYNTLSCVPKSGLSSDKYGDIFDYICGNKPEACEGINGNVTTGVYGSFSMCNSEQKLGYVLNQYYSLLNGDSSACDFDGEAVVTKAAGAQSSCSAALSSASAANSVAATATAGASASASASDSFARPMTIKSAFTIGDLAIGAYVVIAMGVGAAMVAL